MISFRRKRTVIWSMHPGTGYWCSGRVQVAGHPHWHPAEMEDLHRGSIQEGDEQAPFPKTAESFQCVEQNPGDFLLPRLCCDVLWEQQSGWTDKLGWLCNWLDTKLWWRGGHWSNQWSILITYWTDWHLGKKDSNAKYKHYEKKAQNYSFNIHLCWLFSHCLLYYFDISYDLTWIINLSFYIWIILCVYMSMHECLYLFFDSGNMGFHKCQFLTT